ncbi:MAG: hypothetical protein DI598_01630 [Pseudopedobacter saltans]|uniref:Uncharacterized protein n=1 Tax=Pseudopedobacter saltans TaxID=151895 RepID=A0A2W5FCQ3_9SPHI|nr:MAG: hypothetical protein DI598_01630 [Pseudopedobacter saltans]
MNYTVVKVMKSKGIAFLLTIFFGGFGLFYVSVTAGLVMGFLAPIVGFTILFKSNSSDALVTGLLLLFTYYITCFIWAIVGVSRQNRRIQEELDYYNSTNDQDSSTNNDNQVSYFSNDPTYSNEITTQRRGINIWLFVLVILSILGFLFYLYDSKTNSIKFDRITTVFTSHPTDKQEIKDQLEDIYANILNGSYSSSTIAGTSAKGLPFYNTPDMVVLMGMGFAPLAQALGTEINLSPTDIKVHDFNDSSNTAKLDYVLSYKSGKDSSSMKISMIVKKINGKWKFDATRIFGKHNNKGLSFGEESSKKHSNKTNKQNSNNTNNEASITDNDEQQSDDLNTNTFKINKEEYEDGGEKEYNNLYLFFQSGTISLIDNNSLKKRWTITNQSSDGEYDVFKLSNGDKIYKKAYDISLFQKEDNSTIHYNAQPAKNNLFL